MFHDLQVDALATFWMGAGDTFQFARALSLALAPNSERVTRSFRARPGASMSSYSVVQCVACDERSPGHGFFSARDCYRVARQIAHCSVPTSDVEDVVQEVMLRYVKRWGALPFAHSVRWTAKVAWNVCRAWHRDQTKSSALGTIYVDPTTLEETVLSDGPIPGESRTDPPIARPALPLLLRWIEDTADLTEQQKQVLWRHFRDGESVKAVARRLETDPKQIRRWIAIILRRCATRNMGNTFDRAHG